MSDKNCLDIQIVRAKKRKKTYGQQITPLSVDFYSSGIKWYITNLANGKTVNNTRGLHIENDLDRVFEVLYSSLACGFHEEFPMQFFRKEEAWQCGRGVWFFRELFFNTIYSGVVCYTSNVCLKTHNVSPLVIQIVRTPDQNSDIFNSYELRRLYDDFKKFLYHPAKCVQNLRSTASCVNEYNFSSTNLM